MADVQLARDIGQRQHDDERLPRWIDRGVKVPGGHPRFVTRHLDLARIIGCWEHLRRHCLLRAVAQSRSRGSRANKKYSVPTGRSFTPRYHLVSALRSWKV